MATLVTIDGETYKRRDPLGVIGLVLITLGIYGFVWYYKVNDEARRYLRDESIRPGIALLAVAVGWIVIVPPFISAYRTGERIVRMERRVGISNELSPAIFLILFIVVTFLGGAYVQEHLNRIWDRPADAPAPPVSMSPPSPPAPPMPPMPGA
jgi:hypothetical protein